MEWSSDDKADVRDKFLALGMQGNPDMTTGDLRWPWDPATD